MRRLSLICMQAKQRGKWKWDHIEIVMSDPFRLVTLHYTYNKSAFISCLSKNREGNYSRNEAMATRLPYSNGFAFI